MFELSLSKPPTKEASPATARQARHTTEKYSLLFSFCARRFFSSPNEKSIFLWCLAMNCKVAGLASIFRKNTAEFPPNPPSAFLLLKRNGNGSRRAKIPSPQPPPFLPACLGFAPKTFRRTDFSADRFFSLPHPPVRVLLDFYSLFALPLSYILVLLDCGKQ